MARALPGPLIGTISGNVGGISFARSAGGLTVRRKIHQRQPYSVPLAEAQTNFNQVSLSWENLSSTEKLSWSNLAQQRTLPDRLSGRRSPTARQLYFNYHLGTYPFGQGITSPIPTPNTTPGPFDISFSASHLGAMFVDFYYPIVDRDFYLAFFSSPCIGRAQFSPPKSDRCFYTIPIPDPSAGHINIDVAGQWTAEFGDLLIGSRVGLYIQLWYPEWTNPDPPNETLPAYFPSAPALVFCTVT